MADSKTGYGPVTSIICTITSLGDGSSRESTVINNNTNKFKDALVRIKTKGQAGSTGVAHVFVYSGLETSSPILTDGVTGLDASFTTASIKNSKRLGVINLNGTTAVTAGPFSVSKLFGGKLPPFWGIIINNESGAGLSITSGDHDIDYVGVYEVIT